MRSILGQRLTTNARKSASALVFNRVLVFAVRAGPRHAAVPLPRRRHDGVA